MIKLDDVAFKNPAISTNNLQTGSKIAPLKRAAAEDTDELLNCTDEVDLLASKRASSQRRARLAEEQPDCNSGWNA